MERQNLLGGPPATYLTADEEAAGALRAGEAPADVAARFPAYSAASEVSSFRYSAGCMIASRGAPGNGAVAGG